MLTAIILLAVFVSLSNALPVQLNDGGEVQNRGVRSLTDGLGWHLDRIDQRENILDRKYSPAYTGQGNMNKTIQSAALPHLQKFNLYAKKPILFGTMPVRFYLVSI